MNPDLPVSTRILLHLYKILLDQLPRIQGHHIGTGRYYTSLVFSEELNNMGCHLTDPIYTSKKGLPIALKRLLKCVVFSYQKGAECKTICTLIL